MVCLRVKRLTLHCLVICLRETSKREDEALVHEGQRRTKACSFHLFLLNGLHSEIDQEAIAQHLVLIVLFVALETTDKVDISIESLERL